GSRPAAMSSWWMWRGIAAPRQRSSSLPRRDRCRSRLWLWDRTARRRTATSSPGARCRLAEGARARESPGPTIGWFPCRQRKAEVVTDVRDVIIVGSGPAGYTAALYAARARLNPLLFEGSVTSGGALMNTTDVENFPGFPDGVLGPDLMDAIRKQAERFGAEFLTDDVTTVDLAATPKVITAGKDIYLARTVIVATGSSYRELGVPGEKTLSGHGVSWCATCDGFFFRDQDIAVVLGSDRVSGLRIRNVKSGAEGTLAVTGLFIAIGHDPRSELFAGQLATDAEGYLLVEHPSNRTATEGVFAAGNVVDHIYRQAVTAAGTGCAAALDAERWLADHED